MAIILFSLVLCVPVSSYSIWGVSITKILHFCNRKGQYIGPHTLGHSSSTQLFHRNTCVSQTMPVTTFLSISFPHRTKYIISFF